MGEARYDVLHARVSAADDHLARVELWLVDLQADARALDRLEAATPRLSDADLARLAAIADDGVRAERRAAHVALRIAIEEIAGPEWRRRPFARSKAGKPTLDGVAFSLAHTDGAALIAVGFRGPLGVDIERRRTVDMAAKRRVEIETHAETLTPHVPLPRDGDERLLAAWVRLEAVAKARGTGIGRELELARRPSASGARDDGAQVGATHETDVPLAVRDLALGDAWFAALATPIGAVLAPLRRIGDTAR